MSCEDNEREMDRSVVSIDTDIFKNVANQTTGAPIDLH